MVKENEWNCHIGDGFRQSELAQLALNGSCDSKSCKAIKGRHSKQYMDDILISYVCYLLSCIHLPKA